MTREIAVKLKYLPYDLIMVFAAVSQNLGRPYVTRYDLRESTVGSASETLLMWMEREHIDLVYE